MSELEVSVCADADALAAAACERVVAAAHRARRGRFRIALAGGNTPRRLYRQLAADDRIDWSAVDLFWGDERAVPPDDVASNYRMVREALLDHITIDPSQVYRIETERGAAGAARHYAEHLAEPLDLVLLGMGDDGHTASLFPGTPNADDSARVIVTESPVPPSERISITLPVIDRAVEVMMLVAGASKAERLGEVYRQWHRLCSAGTSSTQGDTALPAARVQPAKLVWVVDEAAAAELPATGGSD